MQRARLVQRVVRACLEGLRAPSASEAQLVSQQQLAAMRRAFVRAVAVDTPVMASIAHRHMARIRPGTITQGLSPFDTDLDDAFFVFDRVISSCVNDCEGVTVAAAAAAARDDGGRGGVLFNFAELCADGRMLHLINTAIDTFYDQMYASNHRTAPRSKRCREPLNPNRSTASARFRVRILSVESPRPALTRLQPSRTKLRRVRACARARVHACVCVCVCVCVCACVSA